MHPDHVTVAVRNLEEARSFFSLLDFQEEKSLVISGPVFQSTWAFRIWRQSTSRWC